MVILASRLIPWRLPFWIARSWIIDDDVGVYVTKPGVEASNTMQGSNIPNPLPEPADDPMISTSTNK